MVIFSFQTFSISRYRYTCYFSHRGSTIRSELCLSFFPAGIWILLAGRVLSSTCTMDWLCLSDGWYGLQVALLNLTCPFFLAKLLSIKLLYWILIDKKQLLPFILTTAIDRTMLENSQQFCCFNCLAQLSLQLAELQWTCCHLEKRCTQPVILQWSCGFHEVAFILSFREH